MKKVLRISLFGLLFLLFSVGFRYSPTRPVVPVNIYTIDSLLLVADMKQGILIYSTADRDTPQLVQTIQHYGVRGVAMQDSTMYIGTWDGVIVYQQTGGGMFDSVNAVYRTNCCTEQYNDVYHSRSFLNCGCGGGEIISGSSMDGGNTGVGGSYAVFAIIDTFLYVVDDHHLVTFSIAKPDSLYRLSYLDINWTIETLYPMESHLYIGGTNGMYIIDRRDAADPKLAGSVDHFRACDPVVVRDSTAWVTLRAGNLCGSAADELWTIAVNDPYHPKLLHTTAVKTPYGLAVQDSLLFVANGYNGYSLYRVNGEEEPVMVKYWEKPAAKDFIWSGNRLFIMDFNGVHIVNVTDPLEPKVVFSIQ